MLSHDMTSSPVALPGSALFAGGSCETCTYWLGSHGCCRSDCDRFRSMIPVTHCGCWRPLPAATKNHAVAFANSFWAEPVRKSA